MERAAIDTLLRKARALADYALNSGQLPDDTHIFEEIDLLTQAIERSEARAIAPLVIEMQKVCKKAHVTVEQLARRETRLGRLSARMARATPFLIGFMTLLLTLYLVFQSSQLHKADLALREYQDLASERLQEKIYNAWKMYRYERVLNVKAPPLAQLDGYQQLISDAKRLYEKRSAVQDLLLDASVTRYAPDFLLRYWPETSMADGAGAAPSPELTMPALDCSEEAVATVATAKPAPFASKAELDKHRRSIDCFVDALELGDHPDYPMIPMVYATRDKVNLLVSWMLPGLYGLLGACVFLMRELLLGNRQSHARGDARIVDLLSLVLRIALGGLAGIIIGWFWVPSGGSPSSPTIAISSVSFGVAFLAGFSIESLFALLDRFVESFRRTDKENPAEEPKIADGKA